MAKNCQITVVDFELLCDFIKTAAKIVDSAKIQLSELGAAIYGARKPFARCELRTNAIATSEPAEFCVLDLAMLTKVLQTVRDVHAGDFSDLQMSLEGEKLCFKSKKFKSKLQTQKESIVEKWLSSEVKTKLTPVFEFKTSRELIRRVKSHQFVFQDMAAVRVYLAVDGEMENGSVFATLGNRATRLDNEITLKFGLVQSGSLDSQLVLDVDRLNLLDAAPSDEQTVSLMDANVLVSEAKTAGKRDSWFSYKLYLSILKP